jgi:hypothetical protein
MRNIEDRLTLPFNAQNVLTYYRPYNIELIGRWSIDVPFTLRESTEEIISWKIPHKAAWYPQPGRTLVLNREGYSLKIKGAGFYNPSNVSYAGTRRTITSVPERDVPMPPLQRVFERDLIHTDPSNISPHVLESVHSTFAPIGGMTLEAAMHDQLMFSRLTAVGLPSNRPLANYMYHDLLLDGKPMGVSVSLLPHDSLSITAYHLYIVWNRLGVSTEAFEFLKAYSGRGDQFSYENPSHRLEVLAKLAYVAGKLLFQFSSMAGLYRFSGGPDNWNIKLDLDAPLYFSDVDTSKPLDAILPTQHGWEVLRNMISTIHNWFYYFLPCLTYEESGYTAQLLQQKPHDFVRAMLLGFFSDKDVDVVEKVTSKIWRFLALPLAQAEKETRIGLRTGEYLLQRFYARPVFHFVMLCLLSELIQGSELQSVFTESDTSPSGIQRFVDMSLRHESHARMFSDFSPLKTSNLIAEILADM